MVGLSNEITPEQIERLARLFEDPQMVESLSKVSELLLRLNESGLLDLLSSLADKKVVENLFKWLMTADFLRLLDNLDSYISFLQQSGEILLSEEKEKTGLLGLLGALRDPEVQQGMTKLVKLLKLLGTSQKNE